MNLIKKILLLTVACGTVASPSHAGQPAAGKASSATALEAGRIARRTQQYDYDVPEAGSYRLPVNYGHTSIGLLCKSLPSRANLNIIH